MKIFVLLVVWGISATYAYEKKITESGVSRKSRGVSVGSSTLPHLHAHGDNVAFADHHATGTLPVLGVSPAVSPAVGPALTPVIAPGLVPHITSPFSTDAVAPSPIEAGAALPGVGNIAENGLLLGAGPGTAILGTSGEAVVGSTHIDLGSIVQHHVHVINRVGVPVQQPYPVQVERRIPISVPHPVDVPVDRPYPVHVPVRVPVKIIKNIPVPVEKPVAVPVKVPVKVPVPVHFKVFHPHPVAVPVEQRIPIPVPDPVIVRRPIPVVIHAHLEHLDHHNLHHHH